MKSRFKTYCDEGKKYFHLYYNEGQRDAVITLDGSNTIYTGEFNIFTRHGKGQFEEELVFTITSGKGKSKFEPPMIYDANGSKELVEMYLPLDDGIKLMRKFVKSYDKRVQKAFKDNRQLIL